jgi:mannose-1-phosphate guanylyltransferase
MRRRRSTWAVVLAAGDGTRLASLTTDARGNPVPKQFCSLNGGSPLVDEAIQRAEHVAPRERVCAVVAERHRAYWRSLAQALPPRNVIVQPENRGTAHGILLAVLAILARDPLADLFFLPADHYVREERRLAAGLETAARAVVSDRDALALIGIGAEEPDPELGYVVPGATRDDGTLEVARFVEKPDSQVARDLIAAGACWNSFIFGASGSRLRSLLQQHLGSVVDEMSTALARDAQQPSPSHALAELYGGLPAIDFSRVVMQRAAGMRLVPVHDCGWSDLGTPRRVAEALRRLAAEQRAPRALRRSTASGAHIDLASRHILLASTG